MDSSCDVELWMELGEADEGAVLGRGIDWELESRDGDAEVFDSTDRHGGVEVMGDALVHVLGIELAPLDGSFGVDLDELNSSSGELSTSDNPIENLSGSASSTRDDSRSSLRSERFPTRQVGRLLLHRSLLLLHVRVSKREEWVGAVERVFDSETDDEFLEVGLERRVSFLQGVEPSGELEHEGNELEGWDGGEGGTDLRVEGVVSEVTEPERGDPVDKSRVELVRDREDPSEHDDGRLEVGSLGSVESGESGDVLSSLPDDLLGVVRAGRRFLLLRDLSTSSRLPAAADLIGLPLVPRLVEPKSLDVLGGIESVVLLLREVGESMVDDSELGDLILILEKFRCWFEEGRSDPLWVVRSRDRRPLSLMIVKTRGQFRGAEGRRKIKKREEETHEEGEMETSSKRLRSSRIP